MFFQYVLKGIHGIDRGQAEEIMSKTGIQCNWLRSGKASAEAIGSKLTEENLMWHLSRYEDIDPGTGRPFFEATPFISTSAGTVVDDFRRRRIYIRDAFFRAAVFATDRFRSDGWILHGYVYTLGRPSIELQEFAEEVRDLHVHTRWLKYRFEGEITAKMEIPSARLHCARLYQGPDLRAQLRRKEDPQPVDTIENDHYCPPERFTNIRERL
jgi:hypothetical protein